MRWDDKSVMDTCIFTLCLNFTADTTRLLVLSLLLDRRCLMFGSCRASSSTKKHTWETMTNGRTYSDWSCGGSHLSNHSWLSWLSSRGCRGCSRRGSRCMGGSITSWSTSSVSPTRLSWCSCRRRTWSSWRTTARLTLPFSISGQIFQIFEHIRLTGIFMSKRRWWFEWNGQEIWPGRVADTCRLMHQASVNKGRPSLLWRTQWLWGLTLAS